MHLEIGNRVYDLRTVAGPLRFARKHCASVCDHRTRQILISGAIPLEVRPEVVALAVSEAWKHESLQRPPLRFVGDVE